VLSSFVNEKCEGRPVRSLNGCVAAEPHQLDCCTLSKACAAAFAAEPSPSPLRCGRALFLPNVQATKTWNDAIASRVAASDKGAARDAGACLRSPRRSHWMRAPIAVCGRLFHGGGREALATYRTDAAVGKLLIGVLRLETRRYRYPATTAALPLSAVSAQVCRSSATVSCGPALDRSGAPAS
jgi:hypothetical protein